LCRWRFKQEQAKVEEFILANNTKRGIKKVDVDGKALPEN